MFFFFGTTKHEFLFPKKTYIYEVYYLNNYLGDNLCDFQTYTKKCWN